VDDDDRGLFVVSMIEKKKITERERERGSVQKRKTSDQVCVFKLRLTIGKGKTKGSVKVVLSAVFMRGLNPLLRNTDQEIISTFAVLDSNQAHPIPVSTRYLQ
jgi:hypothetical protein